MTKPTQQITDAMPRSVRVFAYDIAIKHWGSDHAMVGENFGEFISITQTIYISVDVSAQTVLDTLIHEINHAVYWALALSDDDEEERLVSTISTAWTQIYRDNPNLISWIGSVVEYLNSQTK